MSENKNTLISLTRELSFLDELLEQNQGEINNNNEIRMSELVLLLEQKTDGCAEYIQHEKNLIRLAGEKIKQLNDFIKARENKVASFTEYIKLCLKISKKDYFAGELMEIKLRKPSQKLEIFDDSKIPAQYIEVEQTVKVLKDKIKTDLENGVPVSGAKLIEGEQGLNIGFKTKKGNKNEQE